MIKFNKDNDKIQFFKDYISKEFKIKDLGTIKYVLGINIVNLNND